MSESSHLATIPRLMHGLFNNCSSCLCYIITRHGILVAFTVMAEIPKRNIYVFSFVQEVC